MFCLNNEGCPVTLLLLEPGPAPPFGVLKAAPLTGPPSPTPPPARQGPEAAAGCWRLSVMVQRSAEEMVGVHAANKDWSAALEVANAYGLDCDFVYKCEDALWEWTVLCGCVWTVLLQATKRNIVFSIVWSQDFVCPWVCMLHARMGLHAVCAHATWLSMMIIPQVPLAGWTGLSGLHRREPAAHG